MVGEILLQKYKGNSSGADLFDASFSERVLLHGAEIFLLDRTELSFAG
jgi:hypothetical protein